MKKILPSTYTNPVYPYVRSADQGAVQPVRHPVVVVGAGPVGLSAALDLASRGIKVVVLCKDNSVSVGSRAICFSKKTLEIVHRFAPEAAARMLVKGVTWNLGKVFYKENPVYSFNLLSEEGHKIPAFINLQQYYFEEYLVDAAHAHPLIDLRWQNTLLDHSQTEDAVALTIGTPEGNYRIEAEYLLACDGVHSPIRQRMGIAFEGEKFEENFLIADITMQGDFPTERWFWFDPPFNRGYSALLHKQPDGVWRIDLQLGFHIDRQRELDPARIRRRLRKMLGKQVNFKLEWTSIYQFRCMRIRDFLHGRVIFAGDSAHLVSPFGARGANGGIQDTDNLCWKLAYVLKGWATPKLLETYQAERSPATDENIFHSSNATDFISPKTKSSLLFRNAVLELAKTQPFAQRLVNSGRLSTPFCYAASPLTMPNDGTWATGVRPGDSVRDAVFEKGGKAVFLINELGADFTLLVFGEKAPVLALPPDLPLKILEIGSGEGNMLAERYGIASGCWLLFRPDHYLAAKGKKIDPAAIRQALLQAVGELEVPHSHASPATLSEDEIYQKLLAAYEGLGREETENLHAKLILQLMNEIGDKHKIIHALHFH
jgi:3-(3-hydroxy-phenyl)propionate hydroxylase